MKMTLHIDEALLNRVTSIYGCESKTAAVALALRELERRHTLKSYAGRGLGFTPGELRESLDPAYDLMASRYGSAVPAKGTAPATTSTSRKPHGRRRAR